MQLSRPLDSIDRRIVALLQESAKRTFADIGADVGLSATAVKRRVDRLEGDGVITGYGARINWRALGEGIESLIEIYCADRTSPADVGRSLAQVRRDRLRVHGLGRGRRGDPGARRTASTTSSGSSSGCGATRTSCARRTLIVLSTLLDRP